MGNVNFVPKDVQRISSSHKILERYKEKMFYQKAVLRNFTIFTGKYLCWSLFLRKMQAFSPATLLKRNPNAGVFCE